MTKMTYVDALNAVLSANTVDSEVQNKLTALRDSLVKRATSAKTGERKPTAKQKENAGIKDRLVEFFTMNEPMQAKDIAAAMGLTQQRVSALCNQLVDEKRLAKTTEKRVSLFGKISQ